MWIWKETHALLTVELRSTCCITRCYVSWQCPDSYFQKMPFSATVFVWNHSWVSFELERKGKRAIFSEGVPLGLQREDLGGIPSFWCGHSQWSLLWSDLGLPQGKARRWGPAEFWSSRSVLGLICDQGRLGKVSRIRKPFITLYAWAPLLVPSTLAGRTSR